jgi:transcriptional regulator with XRE-family HTH domain
MTSEDWARQLTHQVAAEVKRRRGEHTVQWLSDRTADYGLRISRSRISDLERGDRGGLLGVAELLVLAAALDVPPILLLFPGVPGEPVEMLPGRVVESWDAARWFTGEEPSPVEDPDHIPPGSTQVLRQLRALADVDQRLVIAASRVVHPSRNTDPEFVSIWADRAEQAARERNRILQELAERGAPPGHSDRWRPMMGPAERAALERIAEWVAQAFPADDDTIRTAWRRVDPEPTPEDTEFVPADAEDAR